jgi:hypothetical protein
MYMITQIHSKKGERILVVLILATPGKRQRLLPLLFFDTHLRRCNLSARRDCEGVLV